jgi:hypothetical protein
MSGGVGLSGCDYGEDVCFIELQRIELTLVFLKI